MPERKRRTERYDVPAPEPVRELPAYDAQPMPPARELMATNTGVRLACTMAAMIGLFAVFLCWAEHESRVIRRYAVQSAALTAVHAVTGAASLLINLLLGGIPYLGLMVTLICLLGYIAALIALIVMRVRMMKEAWQGVRFDLPAALERRLNRYY